MTSWVIAFRAPRTLKRCRPLGALIQHRAKHHRYPRNAPKTKWAASTKKTARSPVCASAKRGSSFFFDTPLAPPDQLWPVATPPEGISDRGAGETDGLGSDSGGGRSRFRV